VNVTEAMNYAVELAAQGPAYGPNPRVGAVLLRGGDVIGVGWHRGAGSAHAEAAALQDAQANGNDATGATLVVTLEPCRHHGRTPPCTDLIINAGIADVVYACADPGDRSGGGATELRRAGIEVSKLENAAATELIHAWATSIRLGRPYVTVKLATSLDGRVAAADGTSQWITGSASRAHAHQVRAQVDAIVVTTGTVLADNPALTARMPDGTLAAHQPLRVVVGQREIPADARLYESAAAHSATASASASTESSRHAAAAAPVLCLPTHDITEVLAALAERQVRQVLIEGGPALVTACFAADAVDEVHAYLAPVVLGAGPSAVSDYGATTLGAAERFTTNEVRKLGDDVLLIARKAQVSGN